MDKFLYNRSVKNCLKEIKSEKMLTKNFYFEMETEIDRYFQLNSCESLVRTSKQLWRRLNHYQVVFSR